MLRTTKLVTIINDNKLPAVIEETARPGVALQARPRWPSIGQKNW